MPRVAFITHSPYPIEPRARRMAEAVAAKGYPVDVFCLRFPGEPDTEEVNGVSIHRLPVTRHQGGGARVYIREYLQFFLLAAWRIVKNGFSEWSAAQSKSYALIQVYNPPDILAFSTLLPRLLTGTRVILDVRDMAPELFMSRFNLTPDHFITRTLRAHERWASKYAHAVTVCTDHQFNVMAARGISKAKMTVVMNTPDDAIFGSPPLLRSQRRTPGAPFTLIYHGSVLARYGIDVLIQAASLLVQEIPTLQVQIYGFGDFKPTVQAQAQALGLDGIVRFHERLPLEAMPAAIAAADVGVVPVRRDVFTDTILPTKLMEYAHMGVPAVVGRTSTTTEYFPDTMVAYFAPDDAADLARQVLTLYREPARADALVAAAREFTERYNWERDKAAYNALIERLIGDKT